MPKLNISVKLLYQGCIVSTVVHALWVRKYPFAKYMHYWDNFNCHFNDLEGNLATISFFETGVVGVIYRKELHQDQSLSLHKQFLENLLDTMPNELRKLAEEETIQYFIQNIQGEEFPLISDLFWSADNFLASSIEQTQWNNIWLKLIKNQLLGVEEELLALQKEYNLNENEMQLMSLIINKKISTPNKIIEIRTEPYMEKILKSGDINISIHLLKKMGIFLIMDT